ncbi:PEP-CTERM sorting domain-containing protein [Geomonas diazotrophica]|nr:PEP-CTERM sorting domain-containing protein [Geomonas nitrogeniifigens]
MGKMLLTVLVLGLLGVARPGFSYSLISDSAQVGGRDNLLQCADLSNSGQAEIDWIQSFFPDASISLKQEDFQSGDWQKVDYGYLWALYLSTSPDYFLVKTGNTGTYTHYLFENLDDPSWAVISLSDVNIRGVVGISKISHVDEIATAPVPEPGTALLLATGFLGLAWYGKRRRGSRL